MLSAIPTALIGGVFAYWVTFIDPDSTLGDLVSDQALVMVIFGGMGTLVGPVIGAVLIFVLQDPVLGLPVGLRGALPDHPGRGDRPVGGVPARTACWASRSAAGAGGPPRRSRRPACRPPPRRRREAMAEPILRVERVSKAFGGPHGRERRLLRDDARGDPGPDRPQRGRQDHPVQRHQRLLPAHPGPGLLQGPRHQPQAALLPGGPGHRPDLPGGEALRRADRAGEHHHRLVPEASPPGPGGSPRLEGAGIHRAGGPRQDARRPASPWPGASVWRSARPSPWSPPSCSWTRWWRASTPPRRTAPSS